MRNFHGSGQRGFRDLKCARVLKRKNFRLASSSQVCRMRACLQSLGADGAWFVPSRNAHIRLWVDLPFEADTPEAGIGHHPAEILDLERLAMTHGGGEDARF